MIMNLRTEEVVMAMVMVMVMVTLFRHGKSFSNDIEKKMIKD